MSRLPLFPIDEHFITHTRAVLAMLLRGEHCDQFSYHQHTGLPIADFRTRVSELYRNGWPIERAFHHTHDANGEPRRCKYYWLDRDLLKAYFRQEPAFKTRCEAFGKKYGGSPCKSR
ncbi:hypothetical protein OCT51_11105 [Halomonas sp. LR3S48]|uniref:hypothetical protein n=1 Tax=Halomonas sp. LR3S48 TaxID=2982694 RepID=UPI0021E45249|nr:hypothetical protein [Halomonas sp. LR3S48]UYG01761.1 hypothetical protein OCT51_11105 [Halomonas sp. LR3S48]